MSLTDRELGALEREVAEIRHDLRNARTSIQLLSEEINILESDLSKFKTRITTAGSVIFVVVVLVGWVIEVVLK